ncbi:MAG: M48 family metalloprotease [Myxococcota bacterium]|nr:M48 family metalloprotease [Myxococcota bacterium]
MPARVLLAIASLALVGCAALPAPGPSRGWIYRHGGLLEEAPGAPLASRAEALLDRLRPHCDCEAVTLGVVDDERVGAYAFPNGTLFVTRALLESLDDVQVMAALAHELGHLDGTRHGNPSEHRADASGCDLLEQSGVAPSAMLDLVMHLQETTGREYADGLSRRELALRERLGHPAH